MRQCLKSASRAAWAQIIAPELLGQFDVAVDDRSPRLTRVSDGNELRRLRVVLKVEEVVERCSPMTHLHGVAPLCAAAAPIRRRRASQVAFPAESASRLPNPSTGGRTAPSRRSVTLRRGEPAIEAFIPR